MKHSSVQNSPPQKYLFTAVQTQAEAERYESLGEEERDHIWNEGAESIEEEDAEGDEIDLPIK